MKQHGISPELSMSRQQHLISTESLPREVWVQYGPVMVSNKSRYISQIAPKIFKAEDIRRIGFDGVYVPLINILAEVFLGYDPNKHFIQKINKKHPATLGNVVLIHKKEDETWRDIPSYSKYKASNLGNIKNIKSNRLITQHHTDEYKRITLNHDIEGRKHLYVHRVVYATFHPDEDISGLDVNHLDSHPSNNRLDNLEACSHKDNVEYSMMFGNRGAKTGRIESPYIPEEKQNRFSDWKF